MNISSLPDAEKKLGASESKRPFREMLLTPKTFKAVLAVTEAILRIVSICAKIFDVLS